MKGAAKNWQGSFFFKVYVTGLIFDLKKKWKCTQDYVYRFCEHK